MEDYYIYIIQVNVALLVFYLLYKVLFARDTFLEIRRLFLMTVVALAFSYPLISFSSWLEPQQPLQVVMVNYTEMLSGAVAVFIPQEEATIFTWQNGICLLWGMGSLYLFLRMLVQFMVVCRMAYRGKVLICQGCHVIALNGNIAPFSFFGWIFVNPECHEEKELSEIMAHEKTHVRQWHSLDMMVGELLCIVFWFNPVVWLFRKEIRQNLEFLADNHVVSSGYNRKNYQYHLLRLSHQSTAVQIVNNFNVSPLKKRIIMMNKKRTSRIGLVKYALLIPVTGVLVLSANAGTLVEMAGNTLQEWKTILPQEIAKENKMLTGKVLDENGKPLPGVSLIIKGTPIGTISDLDGNFRLEVSEPGTLCFSYVGKKSEYRAFNMQTGNLTVKMEKDALQLEKVVVTAYVPKKEVKEEGEIFVVVEDMPTFPGGNIQQYIARMVKYPVIAAENGIEGTVYVSFVVNHLGKVTDAKVVRSVDASLDKEALRVINSMPDWKPGKQRGIPVDVQYTMPIEFGLCTPEPEQTKVNKFYADTVSVSENDNKIIIQGVKRAKGSSKPLSNEEFQSFIRNYGNGKPAFLVDGELMPADFNANSIPIDKIKSFTVLKPVSAIKIYGENTGRNGVIVIDTKDGKTAGKSYAE